MAGLCRHTWRTPLSLEHKHACLLAARHRGKHQCLCGAES